MDENEIFGSFEETDPAFAAEEACAVPAPEADEGVIFGTAAPEQEETPLWKETYPAAPVKPRTKQGNALKIAIIALCVLVVIAGVLTAVLGGGLPKLTSPFANFDFRIITPFTEDGDGIDGFDDFDNYYDFFRDYYNSSSVIAGTDLRTAPARDDLTLELTQAQDAELTLAEIYEKCAPSVVGIMASVDEVETSWGTGVVFSEDGYIVTNYHIIDGMESAKVVLWDDSEYECVLIGYDSDCDLAVLKIDATGLTPAQFGDSGQMRVGDAVVAIGNPLGEEFRGTMTDGIISAIDRNVTFNGKTMTLLQTNAAINEGNSGGPLINMYGQVIGITNMKMTSYYSSIEGIGFAIPSRVIQSVVEELLDHGYVIGRPAIGIVIGPIPEETAAEYDIPEGLYIVSVQKGSDAYGKGLREGDILVAVNGEPVSTSAEVNAIKEQLTVGDTMLLTIYRDGETFDVEIVLMESGEIFQN